MGFFGNLLLGSLLLLTQLDLRTLLEQLLEYLALGVLTSCVLAHELDRIVVDHRPKHAVRSQYVQHILSGRCMRGQDSFVLLLNYWIVALNEFLEDGLLLLLYSSALIAQYIGLFAGENCD